MPGVELVEKMYDAWMICGDIHCLSTKVGAGCGVHSLGLFERQSISFV